MKLNDLIKFEKANMNKIRYVMNYRIAPLYAFIAFICIVTAGVLITIDESRYMPAAIGLFVFTGVVSVGLFSSVPFVRKKEIEAEMKRYDFDTKDIEIKDIYDFSDEDTSIRFDKHGMYVNGTLFWYNQLRIVINTSNYLKRVWIFVQFFIIEADSCEILLTGEIIHMIEKFNIHLQNRETLDYIVHHKKEAFTRIYKTGNATPPQ